MDSACNELMSDNEDWKTRHESIDEVQESRWNYVETQKMLLFSTKLREEQGTRRHRKAWPGEQTHAWTQPSSD